MTGFRSKKPSLESLSVTHKLLILVTGLHPQRCKSGETKTGAITLAPVWIIHWIAAVSYTIQAKKEVRQAPPGKHGGRIRGSAAATSFVVKQSGMGRAFGRAVIEAYTELKLVCIAY